jgi:hypothetical protein
MKIRDYFAAHFPFSRGECYDFDQGGSGKEFNGKNPSAKAEEGEPATLVSRT